MKNKSLIAFIMLAVLILSCTEKKAPCGPLRTGDSFKAAFIRAGACGSLNDVEFVYNYNGETCIGEEMVVDMKKYNSDDTGKKCQGHPIYLYTKM